MLKLKSLRQITAFQDWSRIMIGRLSRTILVILGLSPFAPIVPTAEAIPNSYQTFQEWCVNQSQLTQAQQHTIQTLLELANTEDCTQANQHLSQLTSLNGLPSKISDLSPLTSLPQLISLSLPGHPIQDLSPLSQLPNLKFMIVAFAEVKDISPLAELTQLQTLILDNNQIQDLSPLRRLPQLKSLIALNNPLASKRCPKYPVSICVFSDEGAPLVQEAHALNERGEFVQARALFNQARMLYEQQDDPMRLGNVLNHLADLDLKEGHYADAINGYDSAIALRRQLGDLPGIGHSLVQQAKAFEQLGLFDKSEEKLIEATENSKRQWALGIPLEGGLYELPKDTGALYQTLAVVQNRIGKYQEALTAARFSLKNYGYLPDDYAGKRVGNQSTLAVMGQTYQRLGLTHRAQDTLDTALELARTHNDREGMGNILSSLGELAIQNGQYEASLSYLQEAFKVQDSLGNKPDLGKTLHLLGQAQLRLGETKQAVKTFLSAIEIWESLRPGLNDDSKVALFETQLATYEQLQSALLARNQTKPALEISERGRARAFVELIASQLGGDANDHLDQSKPPSIQEIRAIAKTQNATLVEYSIVDETLIIWVIQPSGEITVRTQDLTTLSQSLDSTAERSRLAAKTGSVRGTSLNTETILTEIVRNNRQALLEPTAESNRGTGASDALFDHSSSGRAKNRRLHSTYQLLIDPIADLLPENPEERVVIVPQGPLFLVPFAALQDEKGQYLVEKHTLVMTPAISVLALTHHLKTGRSEIDLPSTAAPSSSSDSLIVGNPTMPSIPLAYGEPPTELSPLPGAESEAIAIAGLLKTDALTGNEAQEPDIVKRMKSASVIHLATHGLLDELKYLGIKVPGAIALSPTGTSSRNDGLLTSEEILNMDLIADLVVLSACNTGRGKITGDGVVGLSRSFISAGAPSVVVSLWAVPDAPTSMLMKAFYQQLQSEPDKAKALRVAMLKTMEAYPHPQDWGAFILMGEAE